MPYQISWLIEEKILYTEYTGVMSIEILRAANEEKLALLDTLAKAVYDITDVRLVTRFPISLIALKEVSTAIAHHQIQLAYLLVQCPVLRMTSASVACALGLTPHQYADESQMLDHLRARAPEQIPATLSAFPRADAYETYEAAHAGIAITTSH
ncbi:hypothetical protein G4Y79_02415 [Phototrophicus methaneseepsis]|uniref:Uncharacterized protein n=1 Tax=Phototrophicus methaneseepsis TaxID=2710758 RepID=A0A7S8IE31_9CHLR|nr:hypothetical protein [Phototrophicus methaneseepsis]QPC83250.1 hypothetical protein G4Y79_02415 [Phototrophicus methaneseepsis]